MDINTIWQELWNIKNETTDKIHETFPNLEESLCNGTKTIYDKQESVVAWLEIGHTGITHSYLLKREDYFSLCFSQPLLCETGFDWILRFSSYLKQSLLSNGHD